MVIKLKKRKNFLILIRVNIFMKNLKEIFIESLSSHQ